MPRRRTTTPHSERRRVGRGEAGAMALRLALPRDTHSRPFSVEEAHSAAILLASEWRVEDVPMRVLLVGVILDLRPGDLTPRRRELARFLRASTAQINDDEILWEMLHEDQRCDFVRRAVRIILSMRGAA